MYLFDAQIKNVATKVKQNFVLLNPNGTFRMKQLELNIETIGQLAKQKEKENYEFRSFLKTQNSDFVDRITQRFNTEIASLIDCTQCGNCCKSLRSSVSETEIQKLSKLSKLTKEKFETNCVEYDDSESEKFLKDTPCIYLKNKKCSIYSERPQDCRSYPHLHKSSFTSRTLGVIENLDICPIVFNLYESLKTELNFR